MFLSAASALFTSPPAHSGAPISPGTSASVVFRGPTNPPVDSGAPTSMAPTRYWSAFFVDSSGPSSPPVDSAAPTSPGNVSSMSSSGPGSAISGVVLGSVVFIVAIVAGCLFCWKQRRMYRQCTVPEAVVTEPTRHAGTHSRPSSGLLTKQRTRPSTLWKTYRALFLDFTLSSIPDRHLN